MSDSCNHGYYESWCLHCRRTKAAKPAPASGSTAFVVGMKVTVLMRTNGTARLIPADEPVFLLRGQDAVAGDAVRAWADLAEAAGAEAEILTVARDHAAKMDAWPKKKTPDLKRPNSDFNEPSA